MNKPYIEPFIPNSLMPQWDEQAQVAHERMARANLESLLQDMPPVKAVEVGGQRLLYVEMPAIEDSENEALALSLPYANSWKPHMYLRARYLQESAAPDKKLIILPNSGLRDRAYELTKEE
ncbi:MAG: hypothetical protein AAB896_01690 [Patescibacteria group bacterium]